MQQRKTISSLRDSLFDQLDRLSDKNLTGDKLEKEIWRASAVTDVASKIIDSAKVEVDFIRAIGNTEYTSEMFDSTKAIGEGSKSKNNDPRRI